MRTLLSLGCLTALPLALAASPVGAQVTTGPQVPPAAATDAPSATSEAAIDFAADQVSYDSEAELVTAEGQVRMNRDGNYLAADKVTWERRSGQVVATGNVVVVNPQGDKLIGDRVVMADTLRSGVIDNLLIVLESGGRVVAKSGTRDENGRTTLTDAYYTPCPVTSPTGCPKRPSWSIRAARVVHDPSTEKLRFVRGRLNLLGLDLPLLPIFAIGTGSDNGGISGALVPNVSVSRSNGLEVALPYHFQLAPNRDATLTPHLYSGAAPAIEARFRQLTDHAAFQVGAFATYSQIDESDPNDQTPDTRRGFRAFLEGNGKAQFDPYWSLTGSLRLATDKTVTRRYDLTRDAVLRNFVEAERIKLDSYVSIAGWAFQGLRVDDVQKQIPIALPAIDARFRLGDVAGGTVEVQGNSLAILRIDGQDTQRAFTSARWDMRRITGMGQQLQLTAYARADAYHSGDNELNPVPFYAGEKGWQFRAIGAVAADLRWPLVGEGLGAVHQFTPRVQLVLTPRTRNLAIPNEDSRAIDLEDSNLFALNRFPGYDRWEDGPRITYGAEWALDRPHLSVRTVIGQSYRLNDNVSLFPDGTGLNDRLSDIVGRTRVRWGRFVDVTHRFRLDKDNLAVRRNEVDLTVGTDQTYALIGYLRLDRNIDPTIEDLRDKEELRLAGRWRFHRYWSLFGATVFDLTGREEDPLSLADGYEPVRHRIGIAYEDDCLELGLQWKRDYDRIGDFRSGNRFSFHIALKGLGR